MSIENFTGVGGRILLHSCHLVLLLLLVLQLLIKWFGCVSHAIYVPCLDLGSFGQYQSLVTFIWALFLICEGWSDV